MIAELCRAHQQSYFIFTLLLGVLFLTGCAGPNPNIGERTSDRALLREDYERALEIIRPHAEKGEPWAQLRLALAYEDGYGVEKNLPEAAKWYHRVAVQKGEGDWAEGKMIGAFGKTGYFNRNSDARIAQVNLAEFYLDGSGGVPKNLIEAYFNIRTVMEETNGYDIFFCCEFAGGVSVSGQIVEELYNKILKEMSPEQLDEAKRLYPQWKLPVTLVE